MTSAGSTSRGYAIDLVIDADGEISGSHDHGDLVPLGVDLLDGVYVATCLRCDLFLTLRLATPSVRTATPVALRVLPDVTVPPGDGGALQADALVEDFLLRGMCSRDEALVEVARLVPQPVDGEGVPEARAGAGEDPSLRAW